MDHSILICAGIATVEIIIRDVPFLWRPLSSEYGALRHIIQNVLLGWTCLQAWLL
jgi:hypothetical protein